MKKHKHIVAFHIGHCEIRQGEKRDPSPCCGGVMELNYCPECGKKLPRKPRI